MISLQATDAYARLSSQSGETDTAARPDSRGTDQTEIEAMSIQIKRRLDPAIYRSEGGGETRVRHELAAGPRNLLRAIALLRDERREAERGYGSIGAGRTWMEIDGQAVDDVSLSIVEQDDREALGSDYRYGGRSRTEKARRLLAAIARGDLNGWAGR